MACKCPRCGQGRLYDGFLKVAERCPRCGLDYSRADSGDGPAIFLLFIVGFIAVLVLVVLRFGLGAPAWAALLASLVSCVVATWISIRPLKAYMVALQYANKAREGHLNEEGSDWSDRDWSDRDRDDEDRP
ncbi:DUF983 domain-containing protein [Aquisalinus flavus]|uniref:Membrane protein n=1 Tax=Aquisalinus flavus TaxID=1526572 RepID=A0A8J2Y713_9PROT|nr:DUF983 domain-containing protein [Aquisalinus flavus]MBD0426829.1 DUF983 domain-containing protein [Aquisalinus flavus]UNE46677.1 DUF983 domain-containing protein [Aquisalinus flavus]GGC96332.1 membrane protein [Aquisalinus flavus]